MDNVWLVSALWLGSMLTAWLVSIWIGIPVALVEIIVGALAGDTSGLSIASSVNYLAVFGAILPTLVADRIIGGKSDRLVRFALCTIVK